jgi:hypothetical protein
MSIKDALENVAKTVTHAIDDVRDAASEAAHRTAAQAEEQKRENTDMSLVDKAKSVFNQAKHETLAEVDATKRDVRNAS